MRSVPVPGVWPSALRLSFGPEYRDLAPPGIAACCVGRLCCWVGGRSEKKGRGGVGGLWPSMVAMVPPPSLINLAWFARAGKVESVLTAAEVTFILTSGQFGHIWVPFSSMPTLIVDNSVGWHLETNSFHQNVRLI